MPENDGIRALVFDLDGVVTDTASVHAEAWKRTFDEYLGGRGEHAAGDRRPFDISRDYVRYVDGKPRYEGARSFLESRGIELPLGDPSDPPDAETVCGLGNRKDRRFHELLRERGVDVYPSSVAFLVAARERGVRIAVMTSSRNGREVLASAGVTDLFDAVLDGTDAERLGLPGKPDPAMFVAATSEIGAAPRSTAVLEDAVAGVEAGRRGGFGLVVGVDRTGHRDDLELAGAHIVVDDLAELDVREAECRLPRSAHRRLDALPSALDAWGAIERRIRSGALAVFLDYDGTLTPIVGRPEDAVLSPAMRATVQRLASRLTVAVISGRDAVDVRRLVDVTGIHVAGSHGLDILGPDGMTTSSERNEDLAPHLQALDSAEKTLREALADVDGAMIERKRYGVATHYRLVEDAEVGCVVDVVHETARRHPGLRLTRGKKVLELRPDIEWDKGRALLDVLGATLGPGTRAVPLFIGDDVTDEDAFEAIRSRGIGIVVGSDARQTAASYRLDDVDDVGCFLEMLARFEEAGS